MLDIKMIRLNEDEVKTRLATRNIKPEIIDELLEQDKVRRELVVKTESLKQKRNEVSQAIAQAKKKQGRCSSCDCRNERSRQ